MGAAARLGPPAAALRPATVPGLRTDRARRAAVNALGLTLAEADDLEQLGEAYLEAAGKIIDFPMSAVYLFGEDSTSPSWYASRNVSARFMTMYERLGRPIDAELRTLLRTAEPVYNLANYSIREWRETEIYQLVDRIENMLHVLKAPIVVHDRIIGTIDFASDQPGADVGEFELDLISAMSDVVGAAVRSLRRRQRVEQQLTVASLALQTSSAAVVYFGADSDKPTVTPAAAALIAELHEGNGILYRILRDTGPSSGETHRSYLVRLHNGTKDVLNCTIRSVPDQPGAEVIEISLEAAETRYVNRRVELLSNRELDVSRLVVAGFSDREIADELTLSLYTVRQHVKNIYQKLDVNSRVQLTRIFFGKTARGTDPAVTQLWVPVLAGETGLSSAPTYAAGVSCRLCRE